MLFMQKIVYNGWGEYMDGIALKAASARTNCKKNKKTPACFLARPPEGRAALPSKQHEKRHTIWYAFFRGWGEVIRTPE